MLLISNLKLPRNFYERPDVVQIARDLLGKKLFSSVDNQEVSGLITEVEAYRGYDDKACHACNGKRTNRTEVMFGQGGHAYVYLCYGIHHLLNIVTNVTGKADAVLIRAVKPLTGVTHMHSRRNHPHSAKALTCGPGVLSQAFGVTKKQHNGKDLLSDELWIEDQPLISDNDVVATTRVGVDYAEEDALKPWRFYVKTNKWISKK